MIYFGYERFVPSTHIQIWRNTIWCIRRFFLVILPEILLAAALFGVIFFLPSMMAVFFN